MMIQLQIYRDNTLNKSINNDEIGQLRAKRRTEMKTLINDLQDASNITIKPWNHYSVSDALNLEQNVENAAKREHNEDSSAENLDIIRSDASILRGTQSMLNTDYQDPFKMNEWILHQAQNQLWTRMHTDIYQIAQSNKSNQKTNSPLSLNVETWPQHEQDERSLIKRLEWELDDASHVDYFDDKYGHMKPELEKYITYNGKTYYFPQDLINDMLNGNIDPTKIPREINVRENYAARFKRQARLADNMFRQLKGMEINHHWFKYNDDDKYMQRANKALGEYQYQTVHDKIWMNYHLDRIHNDQGRFKDNKRIKKNSKVQHKINKLQNYINYLYYHNRRKYLKDSNELAKKRQKLRNKLNPIGAYNTQLQQDINKNQRAANWWQNKINKRDAEFGIYQQKKIAWWNRYGTIQNVNKDPRNHHFGYIRPRNPGSDHSYVYFMVTDESPTYETNVSETPVEWGVNMTTGTQKQQTQIEIEGILFNQNFSSLNNADGQHGYGHDNSNDTTNTNTAGEPDGNNQFWNQYYNVRSQARTIANWCNQGAEMYYSGQDWYPHCVISEWNPDYSNSGDDGSVTSINFSMTITLCDYFQSNEHVHNKQSHRSGQKGSKIGKHSFANKNSPKHVRVKQGWTYIYMARKYGVSVSRLRKLNKWPDERIPVGAEVKLN